MRIGLNLIETDAQIRSLILNSMIDALNKAIDKAIPDINNKIKQSLKDSLRQEPEFASLVSGQLRAEFGLPNSNIADIVVEALGNTVEIKKNNLVANRAGISGGFTLTALKSEDMNGIIYTNLASVVDNERGYALPWLEWLLYHGGSIIVREYKVQYGNSPFSRSGMAIMVESNKNWRVPPEFAGTTRNNWTTRAIERMKDNVYHIMKKEIESNL